MSILIQGLSMPDDGCHHKICIVKCEKRKQQTNADRIRAMSDEEIEKWFWWMHKEMMLYTDSRHFLHDWLKQEAVEGG